MAEVDVNLSDLVKMKVADLKRELKARGLSITGNKNELIERLQGLGDDGVTVRADGGGMDETDGNNTTIDGDVMDESGNGDDAELLDEDDDLEDGLDDELSVEGISETNDSTGTTPATNPDSLEPSNLIGNPVHQTKPMAKRKLMSSKKTELLSGQQPPKKITLNRNTSLCAAASEKENQETVNQDKSNETTESKETNGSDAPVKKVIKLSSFTVKERLELRAQKFGAGVSNVTKREARAIRFGITGHQTSSVPFASAEVLKKRAERFGTAVSPILKKTEQEEKLKLRQQRFGSASPASANVLGLQAKASLEEKKRLRAERFKITTTA